MLTVAMPTHWCWADIMFFYVQHIFKFSVLHLLRFNYQYSTKRTAEADGIVQFCRYLVIKQSTDKFHSKPRLGFILCGPWVLQVIRIRTTSVQNVMTIHPTVAETFQSGPTMEDRQTDPSLLASASLYIVRKVTGWIFKGISGRHGPVSWLYCCTLNISTVYLSNLSGLIWQHYLCTVCTYERSLTNLTSAIKLYYIAFLYLYIIV